MSLSSWLCTKSTKNMLVKIVHPGGHAELHDSPILAAELMLRNPRCCVAYPHIFQQPWAIVAPDTMLRLGQKYYVVPISTIRKLQRLSLKYSPTTIHEIQSNGTPSKEDEKIDENMESLCNWCFVNQSSTKALYSCRGHSNKHEENNVNLASSNHARSNIAKDVEKEGCFYQDNCFVCFLKGTKSKEKDDDLKEETKSSRSISSSFSSSEIETKALIRKRNKDSTRNWGSGSTKRLSSLDHWQPSLERIHEE